MPIAILKRARVYIYKNVKYERNVPKPINAVDAAFLGSLADDIVDAEGDVLRKPMFEIVQDEGAAKDTKPAKEEAKAPEPEEETEEEVEEEVEAKSKPKTKRKRTAKKATSKKKKPGTL